MNDRELVQFLDGKISRALNEEGGELSARRKSSYDYYMGSKYGNEREGHSQVVTREVFETVEWALPSILRVFAADRPVVFMPEGADDEQAAEQETDVLNHVLFERESGFLALHNWAKDSLLYPNGYCKIWADKKEEVTTERYQGLLLEQLVQLSEAEGVEIVAAQALPGPMGEMYDVECKVTRTKPLIRFEAVPPEEVLVDGDLTSVELDESEFVCHRTRRTYSDLVKQGYSRARLDQIGEDDAAADERTNRMSYDEDNESQDEGALRRFWVDECYVQVDMDGDGIAERRRIVKVGKEIMENDEFDHQPIVAMSSIVMPHQHAGIGLAEAVMDLQLVASTLMRQLLTNLYRINQPRKFVGEQALVDGGTTIDSLLNAAAEVIPVRDPSAIVPEIIQSLGQHILPVMQQVTEQKQLRSGVNPQVSIDPEVLKTATMGAFTQALDHASQRLELIVRMMAETGVKAVMRKAHRLVRENFGQEMALKLRGEWVNVHPQEWKERTNLRINVGVGTQSKRDKVQALMGLLTLQEKLMGIGMVRPDHIYAAVSELIGAAGLEGADRFLINPGKEQVQQQPDPMMLAQAEALKAQGQSMLMDGQSKMMRAQIEQAKAQLDREKAQFEAMVTREKAALEQQRAQFEAQMAAGKAQAEVQHIHADSRLKEAQRVKTLEEARALDIESDANESGVVDVLKGVANG